VNFWAEIFAHRVSALEASSPYASKGIDYCGDRKAVSACADQLGAKVLLPALDASTLSSGTIIVPQAPQRRGDQTVAPLRATTGGSQGKPIDPRKARTPAGSMISAIMRRPAPHLGQQRASISWTRRSKSAQQM
jgi:hypothetical protein